MVPLDGGFQVPTVHSLGRARTLEGADYRPLRHFDDALAEGLRIGGGQGGNGPVAPGEGGVLGDAETSGGLPYRKAFNHALAEVEPQVPPAYAVERGAGEIGEVGAALLALVALDASAFAVADYRKAPAGRADEAARHQRVADLTYPQLRSDGPGRKLAALRANWERERREPFFNRPLASEGGFGGSAQDRRCSHGQRHPMTYILTQILPRSMVVVNHELGQPAQSCDNRSHHPSLTCGSASRPLFQDRAGMGSRGRRVANDEGCFEGTREWPFGLAADDRGRGS
ncbi:MAG TPA: hypothetical protein DCL63_10240 [Firmicutes bacterium]|nr:hypothetical protein [Bacillota bacterium]